MASRSARPGKILWPVTALIKRRCFTRCRWISLEAAKRYNGAYVRAHPPLPRQAQHALIDEPDGMNASVLPLVEGVAATESRSLEAASRAESPQRALPFAFARRFGVVVTDAQMGLGRAELVSRGTPTLTALAEVKRHIRRQLLLRTVGDDEFERVLTAAYAHDTSGAQEMVDSMSDDLDLASLADSIPETEDLLEQSEDAPIVRLINALLSEAIRENASDIHVETFEKTLVVRFRVDGVMREIVSPKRALAPLLVSRIKVMAKLDIAEKRVPQDGRMGLRIGGREVDVRVSTLPASDGERVVLRLLDKQAGRLTLPNLGMLTPDLVRVSKLVHRPHGIVLVTGPTGSGKTTTLYASLGELSTHTVNILTVEDPIEYNLAGIGQTQVNPKADMTFARGLRAILRQDPDVVMVGEIRDLETAQIAVQASLTGHLVMSTLHTNTAVGAVTRLMDMGVEPFLLASSLIGCVAQRLVRVLCLDCRQTRLATPAELAFLGGGSTMVFEAPGCEACGHSGYRGRTGIYELVAVDDAMRQLVHDKASEQALVRHARLTSQDIREDGKLKILAGVTSVEEVLRVTLQG